MKIALNKHNLWLWIIFFIEVWFFKTALLNWNDIVTFIPEIIADKVNYPVKFNLFIWLVLALINILVIIIITIMWIPDIITNFFENNHEIVFYESPKKKPESKLCEYCKDREALEGKSYCRKCG